METSPYSIIITLMVWYISLGLFHLAFFWLVKKTISWKLFLKNLLILGLYFSINFLVISLFTQNWVVFGIANIILLFAAGFLIAKFILKQEFKNTLTYALIFTALFNLLWYRLLGAL